VQERGGVGLGGRESAGSGAATRAGETGVAPQLIVTRQVVGRQPEWRSHEGRRDPEGMETRSRSSDERPVRLPADTALAARDVTPKYAVQSSARVAKPRGPPRPRRHGRTDHDPPMKGERDYRRSRRGLLSARERRETILDGAVENQTRARLPAKPARAALSARTSRDDSGWRGGKSNPSETTGGAGADCSQHANVARPTPRARPKHKITTALPEGMGGQSRFREAVRGYESIAVRAIIRRRRVAERSECPTRAPCLPATERTGT